MRIRFFAFCIFIFMLHPLFPQVVIEDSIVVSPKAFPIPNFEDVKLPPAIYINPVTGQRDTLFPREVTYEIVQKEEHVEKSVPLKTAGISTNYYVIFTAKYWTSECPENVIQKQYQIRVAVITAPPGSEHHVRVLYANFDHRWDTIRYRPLGNDKVYFYVIKMLPCECEEYEVCQIPNPSNPEELLTIYLYICEIADTSVPSTQTEDLGDGIKVYTMTWPYAAITDTVIPPYRYEVLLPDTLPTRTATPVIVQAKDRKTGENYYGIDPNLSFAIWTDEAGERLGVLRELKLAKNISEENPREIQTTPYLTNYFSLNTGMVMYLANGETPQSPTPIQIFVNDAYEVPGQGNMVVVGGDTFTITIPPPQEIWPTLRPEDGGNPNGRNQKSEIVVLLRRHGQPVENHNVTIAVEMILPSGGHDHTNQPALNLRGHLRAEGARVVEGDGTVTAPTNSQGRIMVTYTAAQFGGRYVLMARTNMDGRNLEARDTLTVRVPGLVDFASIPSNLWNLTGNTGTTNYGRCRGNQIQHASNHFATQYLCTNLQNAITDFYVWCLDTSDAGGGGIGLILGVNDMSLEYGGLFDICGNWQPAHSSHRIGTSVDIDRSAELLNNPGHFISLTSYQIDALSEFVRDRGGYRVVEATIHYEFRER